MIIPLLSFGRKSTRSVFQFSGRSRNVAVRARVCLGWRVGPNWPKTIFNNERQYVGAGGWLTRGKELLPDYTLYLHTCRDANHHRPGIIFCDCTRIQGHGIAAAAGTTCSTSLWRSLAMGSSYLSYSTSIILLTLPGKCPVAQGK